MVSRSQSKIVAQEAKEAGVKAQADAVDLARKSQVRAKIKAIAAEFCPIEILVNNAGIGCTAPLSEPPKPTGNK